MKIDLDELERLAKAAGAKVWWREWDVNEYEVLENNGIEDVSVVRTVSGPTSAFIAAANPAAVLALIDELHVAEFARDQANAVALELMEKNR